MLYKDIKNTIVVVWFNVAKLALLTVKGLKFLFIAICALDLTFLAPLTAEI